MSSDKKVYSQIKLKKIILHVGGMRCAVCASNIADNIRNLKGVENCEVNYSTNSCKIEYDSKK